MTRMDVARQRLEGGLILEVLLDAAYEGFGEILAAIRAHQEGAGDLFAAFAYAAAAAAEGRDALAAAPSLPRAAMPGYGAGDEPVLAVREIGDLAADLASLAGVLTGRLSAAAAAAAGHEDRASCDEAARRAEEIRVLLTGGRGDGRASAR